jgi:GT2 family glycosyltransferase
VPGPDRSPSVTVACIPRDHYSDALTGLDAILANSQDEPHELLYVVGRTPAPLLDELRRRSHEHGFRLLELEGFLVPGQARNLVLEQVETEYLVFIDNDAVPGPGWLRELVRCADETGAAQVAPTQLIGPLEDQAVHVAGGFIHIGEGSPRSFVPEYTHQGRYVHEVEDQLVRRRCDLAEFHCQLNRVAALRDVGGYDERLLSGREVEDVCMRLTEAGHEIWYEPGAVVAFLPPTRVTSWTEVLFLSHRWGERANRKSFRWFLDKHDFDDGDLSALGFVNGIRRANTGAVKHAVADRLPGKKPGKAFMKPFYAVERTLNWLLVHPKATRY